MGRIPVVLVHNRCHLFFGDGLSSGASRRRGVGRNVL